MNQVALVNGFDWRVRIAGWIGEQRGFHASPQQLGTIAPIVLKDRALDRNCLQLRNVNQFVAQTPGIVAAGVLVDNDRSGSQSGRKISFVRTRYIAGQPDAESDCVIE